ncbi:MAG TPA: DegT/DnrJ/EryC1/StrS family aminotransferase [Candidatus Acidoferrales bacterium]|nr:DegT/DnrJ/EryC1/StrS family aminotransferase [Candidatus Acidoferrales bacterium]
MRREAHSRSAEMCYIFRRAMTPPTRTHIPQLDLRAQYTALKPEIEAALARVLASQRFILGPEGEALERELADYCGVPHAIGCASGSDALLLALVTLGVTHEHDVLTVPFTFFATAGAVARLGARAVFVDIEPRTFNLDPEKLRAHLRAMDSGTRRRCRALIPVHLFGQPADMDAINEIAAEFDLPVIEDAAQAIGADYKGRRVGSLGRVGCFSFYPTKNLGAFGDAGLVTATDSTLAGRLRAMSRHGCTHDKYHHDHVGWNARLDELQATVLRVKFRHLEDWNRARIAAADRYDQLFVEAGLADSKKTHPNEKHPVVIPYRASGRRHVFHQYVIRAHDRDALKKFLTEEGVGTEVYYPLPLHLQSCFHAWGGHEGDFPEAERAAREVLALPIYPELTPDQQSYVADRIAAFYHRR